jgi:hypothetical protein
MSVKCRKAAKLVGLKCGARRYFLNELFITNRSVVIQKSGMSMVLHAAVIVFINSFIEAAMFIKRLVVL